MNTATLAGIALRNLRRHTRRTVINVLSVGISVGILFFFLGYYRGTYIVMMRESFIRFKTAHVQMQSPDFNEKKPQDFVTEKTIIPDYREALAGIASEPGVTAASGRLIGTGYAGNGREKMVVQIVGADPAADRNVTVVDEYIEQGSYLDGEDGVLIGRKTADLFGLKVGDLCYVQAQTIYNSPNILLLPVAGIYNTGFYELDKNTVFISLKNAQALYDTGDAINKVMIFLADMEQSGPAAQALSQKYGPRFFANPWEFYGQGILENERGDRAFYAIFLSILIFISVSTIMSTMYVNVFERTREIGTMRAMGWTRKEIFRLFMFESLAIGCIGAFAGFIIGGIPTAYLAIFGVDYGRMSEVISVPIFRIISRPTAFDAVLSFALGIAATYLGGLLPARKAGRMVITDALRVG